MKKLVNFRLDEKLIDRLNKKTNNKTKFVEEATLNSLQDDVKIDALQSQQIEKPNDDLQTLHSDLEDTIFKIATELESEIKEIKRSNNNEVINQLNIRIDELKQQMVKAEKKQDTEIIYYRDKLDNLEIRYGERIKDAIDKINDKFDRIMLSIDKSRKANCIPSKTTTTTTTPVGMEGVFNSNNKTKSTPDITISEAIDDVKEKIEEITIPKKSKTITEITIPEGEIEDKSKKKGFFGRLFS